MNQLDIFDMLYEPFKIKKEIALIELFGGYGSQALSLSYLGVPFHHHKLCEWAVKSIQAYKDIHMSEDDTDYSKDLSVDEIKEYLFNKGISQNYNEPMSKEQIKRLSEEQVRTIYNNIKATHNLVNIQQVKGKDLDITEKDKYTYVMTYSFPCQDLSLAGKGKGMAYTTTRSGMLWEVERILKECKELGQLPDCLLMENVPQVHGTDNLEYFQKYILSLEEMGYKNYWQDMIATDYGIPQTRNRCFMVSILGDYTYTFPTPVELKLKLKDLLESNVDEKYYLSDKMIDFFTHNEEKQKENGNGFRFNVSDGNIIAKTITTKAGSRMDDNFINDAKVVGKIEEWHQRGNIYDENNSMTTICATDYKIPKLVKEIEHASTLKADMCRQVLELGQKKEYDTIRHSYTSSRLNGNFNECKQNNISPTLDTRCDCIGVVVNDYNKALKETLETNEIKKDISYVDSYNKNIRDDDLSGTITTRVDQSNNTYLLIKNNNSKGYLEARDGDGVDISSRMEHHRGTVQKYKTQTLTTMGGENNGVVVVGNYTPSNHNASRVVDNECSAPTVMENHGTVTATQTKDLRIRKLTPRECLRLMAMKDKDINKVMKNQSNASLYHLAGDSIVITDLMALFSTMTDKDWQEHFDPDEWWKNE